MLNAYVLVKTSLNKINLPELDLNIAAKTHGNRRQEKAMLLNIFVMTDIRSICTGKINYSKQVNTSSCTVYYRFAMYSFVCFR